MKKFSPFLLVIVVLVLALAALGVGYGYWTETLDVNGTVTTGNLDVSLANDGGNCDGTVTLASGADLLTFAVTDAYPGYTCTETFDVNNDSSMAVKISSYVDVPASWGTATVSCSSGLGTVAVNGVLSCSATYSVAGSATGNENGTDAFQINIDALQFNDTATVLPLP